MKIILEVEGEWCQSDIEQYLKALGIAYPLIKSITFEGESKE